MRKKTCIEWFENNLKAIANGNGNNQMLNIAVMFTLIAKVGEYDKVSDACYMEMLDECETLSKCWKNAQKATRAQLFINAIEELNLDQKTILKISRILAESYANNIKAFEPDNKFAVEEKHFCNLNKMVNGKSVQGIVTELEQWGNDPTIERRYREKTAANELKDNCNEDSRQIPQRSKNKSYNDEDFKMEYTPKGIFQYLSKRIYGQTDAVKAASIGLYNHINGRKRNMLFAGPTGCGKTEIWRVLSKIYPYIKIVDSSIITNDGWSGGFKIRDIFVGMSREEIEKSIIVFDEFDKLCEPKYASGGENVSVSIQNELLKLIEGADVCYDASKNREIIEFNSFHMSFVFCGSFEEMLKKKGSKEMEKSIGFGAVIEKTQFSEQYKQNFTAEDLVKYAGMRNEIAGRMNQIIQLYPMTADDFMIILKDEFISPIRKLEREYGIEITVDDSVSQELIERAVRTQLGVRYLQSQIQIKIDELMFEDCTKKKYQLVA